MDVVGSPSEMLELWLMDDASFKFAVNAQGERIPDTLLHQLIASSAVGRGVRIRSHSVHVEVLCKHDPELHVHDPQKVTATLDIVTAVSYEYGNINLEPRVAPQHSLWHIASNFMVPGFTCTYSRKSFPRISSIIPEDYKLDEQADSVIAESPWRRGVRRIQRHSLRNF
ncbi:hypothetical protein NliqN6_4840 [Naganishia liquefaciens]|uniref:Uncharacterized protein n=1 Tax=Naganishia liquefaciens TaxID=104408 RepID=A0A8H3TWL9_9TREE|nr:hypothetical protein NliqN6_4840 [Naganishia liquefaciens]